MSLPAERYRLPDEVDTSYAAMQARLIELQPALTNLMGQAMELFDGIFPQAPHPSVDCSVAYAVESANLCPVERIPIGRELTVVLGAGKWVRVFRNTDSSPDAYPRQRLWVSRPENDNHMRINVLRTHDPRRISYPYDIEVSDYDNNGRHMGFVGGADYHGKEPFVHEAEAAIDKAKHVAVQNGLFLNVHQ